jgi:hypothetical protein
MVVEAERRTAKVVVNFIVSRIKCFVKGARGGGGSRAGQRNREVPGWEGIQGRLGKKGRRSLYFLSLELYNRTGRGDHSRPHRRPQR